MQNELWPDKEFLWGVCFSICPDWSNLFYSECMNQREQNQIKI
jgi:hypothetical protein